MSDVDDGCVGFKIETMRFVGGGLVRIVCIALVACESVNTSLLVKNTERAAVFFLVA